MRKLGYALIAVLFLLGIAAFWFPNCYPMDRAVARHQETLVRLHLFLGKDVDERTERGRTPLHFAVANGDAQMTRLLLNEGADVNASDWKLGFTPLHIGALAGDDSIVEILCEAGSLVDATDRTGHNTALTFAASKGHLSTVRLLFSKGGEYSIHSAALVGDTQRVADVLTDNPALIDSRDRWGNTPLVYAICKGAKPTVDLLLSMGADLYIRNNSGQTAIDIAQDTGRADLLMMAVPE